MGENDWDAAHGQDARGTTKAAIRKRHGSYLPHWTKEGGIYAVTFRLADAVPLSVQREWRFERDNIVSTAKQMNRPLTPTEERLLARLFSERIEKLLDAGRGKCWLRLEPVAAIVADALRFFDGVRYRLSAWSIMPNHAHAALMPIEGHLLQEILHSWKSFTATRANENLNRLGKFWHEESYDHLVRDEEDLISQVRYIVRNPEKAGLRDWKWVWVDEELRVRLMGP